MSTSSHRAALRLAGLGAGLALLLAACGEQVPEGDQPPQGSVSPPAVTHLASAQAVSPTS